MTGKRFTAAGSIEILERNAYGTRRIVERNLDKCVLCDLCIQAAPGKVRAVKRYE